MELSRRCIEQMQHSPLGQIESCNYVVQVMCGAFRL